MVRQEERLSATRPIHVGAPNVADREVFLSRVNQILDLNILTNNGPFVRELEDYVCSLFSVKHCVAVANATLGLELLMEALGLKGEIIVPSFTFVATAHAAKRAGLTPVFCDTEASGSGLMDPSAAERLITDNTAAILPVNIYGNVCQTAEFQRIADQYNVRLIFDSAHALGVKYRGAWVGGFGDAEVFSLHATKFVHGFEGGLITTNNDALAEKLKLLRNFGFIGYDQVVCLGTNAKLSEIHAAMALTNLECFSEIVSKNKANFQAYERLLPKPLELLSFAFGVESNFQYVVAKCPAQMRDHLIEALHQHGVLARKYFYPGIHTFSPYNADLAVLPETEKIASQVICLPTGYELDEEIIYAICSVIGEFVASRACLSLDPNVQPTERAPLK